MIKEVTAPGVEPVTLEEAKLHLRVDTHADDALITSLIKVAREYCETFTGRAFITREIMYSLKYWPSGRYIHLPRPPVVEVDAFSWIDVEGNSNPLTEDVDYHADSDSATIALPQGKPWPSGGLYPINPVRIEYRAGYGTTAANVPEYIKAAIKLCIGNWYEHREAVLPAGHVGKELPLGVQALLWQERVFWTEDMNR